MAETQKEWKQSDMVWLENMKWEIQTIQAENALSKEDAILLKLKREGVLK